MKKLLMLLLSVVLAFSAVACGGNTIEMSDDTSYFFISTTDSGHGSAGVKELARRFEEKFKDYSFAPGKKGIVVDVEAKGSVLNITSMAQEAYHAYINPYSVYKTMIGSGDFLNIDEFYKIEIPGEGKTIEDKITEKFRSSLQGTCTKWGSGYYFAPGVSFMGGLTYDKNCFDEFGFYFLAPNQEEYVDYYCGITDQDVVFADPGSALFEEATAGKGYDNWDGWNSNKYLSCGPDGVYCTYDDGMPSSLEELVVLCDYMKYNNVIPFVLSGVYPDNHAYCTDGLINSLLGPENMFTVKTLESDAFEIVTGYQSNSELWGMSDTKVPTTAIVPVTPSQGYYATWSTARYYNAAFWKLAVDQGWYTTAVKRETSHIAAEGEFVFSGYDTSKERAGIMCEASYWINESQERQNFIGFEKMKYRDKEGNIVTGLDREKQIKWMSLPRQIHGTVVENEGTPETFMWLNAGSNNIFNANYAKDQEALEMIKQWLLFFYSDESLKFLTASTGCPLVKLKYDKDIDSSNYDNEPFYRDLFTRMQSGIDSWSSSTPNSAIISAYPDYFGHHGWGSSWTGLDGEGRTELYSAFAKKKYSVQYAFENAVFFMTRKEWAGVFDSKMGTSAMPPTFATDADGNPIKYKSSTIGDSDW